MLAPVKCYTTNGVRFSKTRTTIVLSSVPNVSANQKRRETLLSLLLIFGQEESKKRRLGFVLSHKILLELHPIVCRNYQPHKLFSVAHMSSSIRVTLTPYGRPHPHKIGYYLPILWEDNSVIIPSLLSLPFPIN